jgi:acyl carrier protein
MNTEDIERKVKNVIASKVKDLGVDSFGGIQLLFDLKEEFEVDIPIEDLKKIENVGDIVQCIHSILSTE